MVCCLATELQREPMVSMAPEQPEAVWLCADKRERARDEQGVFVVVRYMNEGYE